VIEHLMEWGVIRIYGNPGDGMNGITTARARVEMRIALDGRVQQPSEGRS
jgi:thiamine pyrophosphate-dependent acetolactate synthase large subunit-like protein